MNIRDEDRYSHSGGPSIDDSDLTWEATRGAVWDSPCWFDDEIVGDPDYVAPPEVIAPDDGCPF